jgi:dihydrofolate reductase
MRLSLIAAVADNGVIGSGNDIPWRLPEDWRRFKATTIGHHLLMGRLTWESIGKPLPGRTTVVISRGRPELPAEILLAGSLEQAISIAEQAGDDEAFVAGGAGIYRLALPRAERLYLTRVHTSIEGDTHFPSWDETEWNLISEELHPEDERHAWPFTFQVFDRR